MRSNDLPVMNKGRLSSLVLNELGPVLEKRREAVINQMKSKFLSGEASHVDLASSVASLVEIDSIINDFENNIKKGQRAEKGAYDEV